MVSQLFTAGFRSFGQICMACKPGLRLEQPLVGRGGLVRKRLASDLRLARLI
jgi:hypothetical protein